MDKIEKFEKFLESFKGKGQDTLIESMRKGFRACFENALQGNGNAIDGIIKGYVDAMFWTEEENEIGSDTTIADLAPETITSLVNDIKKFFNVTHELLNKTPDDYSYEQAGHDFWLTRNGHGAGFWDRGLGDLGDKLTEVSKQFGESYFYKGDDGKLYVG